MLDQTYPDQIPQTLIQSLLTNDEENAAGIAIPVFEQQFPMMVFFQDNQRVMDRIFAQILTKKLV